MVLEADNVGMGEVEHDAKLAVLVSAVLENALNGKLLVGFEASGEKDNAKGAIANDLAGAVGKSASGRFAVSVVGLTGGGRVGVAGRARGGDNMAGLGGVALDIEGLMRVGFREVREIRILRLRLRLCLRLHVRLRLQLLLLGLAGRGIVAVLHGARGGGFGGSGSRRWHAWHLLRARPVGRAC